jgi:hypothetical protein
MEGIVGTIKLFRNCETLFLTCNNREENAVAGDSRQRFTVGESITPFQFG